MSKYVLLWLEGPLQAWGHDSRFSVRSTLEFPTKSGILGMMLAAMGLDGPQEELLAMLSSCAHKVYSFDKGNCHPTTMVDFQMVGSGYDDKDNWEKMLIPKKRDGTAANGGGTKMTYRHYLQDAVFAVIAEIPDEISSAVEYAFESPVWPLCLGRRCCIPSKPIFCGGFDNLAAAEIKVNEIADVYKYKKTFCVVEGNDPEAGDVVIVQDVPIRFGASKKYKSRYVTIIKE